MLDPFNREIDYIRVSVTDRCNLRCTYCMPKQGIPLLDHKDMLAYEEIVDIVKIAVSKGINKVRLTGGEPLVRKGVVQLVQMIAAIKGVKEIAMTTNGLLLANMAKELKDAGLTRVNISLDTINEEKYRQISNGGDVKQVFEGIDAAIEYGLTPIKINCVIFDDADRDDATAVKIFGESKGLNVRFIHQMDLAKGTFSQVEGGEGGNCKSCNRIRLTSNGSFKPCLFSSLEYNIKEHGIEQALTMAINNKPKVGTKNKSGKFNQIGG